MRVYCRNLGDISCEIETLEFDEQSSMSISKLATASFIVLYLVGSPIDRFYNQVAR
jgi:hypothetical protein